MLSKLCGRLIFNNQHCRLTHLLNINNFQVSRQKTLLKRRRITSKKQKVAKKKFLQQNPHSSYAHEIKVLQIQKQLDKKVSKNHHLNELMDELFYPDVRYANQKILEQNLLKISTNPLQIKQRNNKVKRQQQGEQRQFQQYDQVIQQIYLCQIPSQFFEFYSKNSDIFTGEHLLIFFNRLKYYFKNKARVQQRVTNKWKQSLDKLKLTDTQKKKRRRCPYIFLQQEELLRDEGWNGVIRDINKKIAISTHNIANQMRQACQSSNLADGLNGEEEIIEQTDGVNGEEQMIEQSFYSLQNNCDLVLLINSTANYIPEQLFESIVKKSLVIVGMNKDLQKSAQKLPILGHQQKVKLLRVLSLKSKTKSSLTRALHVPSPQNSQKEEEQIIAIGKKICHDVLKSPDCTPEDLGAIIRSGKGKFKFLNSMILELSKSRVLQFLTSTNLERSIDYLYAFWLNRTTKDVQFLQVLMFDIYRKLPYSFSKAHLFFLISFIEQNKIRFKQSQVYVNISQIYPRIAETLAKYLNRGQLTHQEVRTFVGSVYESYPLYKVQSRISVLQMISTAIVKMGEGFRLEEISELLFRITLLGHKSKIFSRYVFQRYQKEYRKLIKQRKSERTSLITDKGAKNDILNNSQLDDLPSMAELFLEQNLILMLWSFVLTFETQAFQLPLNDLLELYPLNCQSQDPMIQDLIQDLNYELSDYNFFPKIKQGILVKDKADQNKKKSFRTTTLLKTRTSQKYKYSYDEGVVTQIVEKLQAGNQTMNEQTVDTLHNMLIRFCIVSENMEIDNNVRLPDRWSDSATNIFERKKQINIKFKTVFLEYQHKKQDDSNNIYQRVLKLINASQKSSSQSPQVKDTTKTTNKNLRHYELL